MATLKVLRDFSALVVAVQALVAVLGDLLQVHRDAGPAIDRVTALELSRHAFEAELQGVLLKADGKLKAANNAEARERQLKKSYERDADPFAEPGTDGTEAGDPVLPIHVAAGEAEGMSALRLGVAPDRKAAALSAKWSR